MNRTDGSFRALLAITFLACACAEVATAEITTATEVASGAKPCAIESASRPFVLINAERMAALRQEVTTSSPRRTRYEQEIRDYADLWLRRDIAIPPRAGHFHEFTCTDGTRLEVPSDFVFRTNEYRCPVCGRTYTGAKYDGGRRNYEHAWLIRAARSCAIVGAVEQRSEYTAKAAEILRKYADAYPAVGRHTKPTVGGIFYQSLDESMHMILLAQAYDLICDLDALKPADKKHIERDLFWEAAEGILNMGIGGNWGSWHLSAVGVIGLATKHQRFIDFGVNSFKSQITEQLGSDGLWPESVHTYHFFPLMAFVDLAEAATNAGIPLWEFGSGGKGMRAMFTAPVQYMYPNLQLPAINDGWFNSFMPEDLYAVAYYRYRLPEFAWILKELEANRPSGRFDPNASRTNWPVLLGLNLPNNPPAPDFASTDFPVLGIGVLRSAPGLMLTFDYGPFLGHGQFDKMGITLFENDRLIAADYGTPSYGSQILPYYTGTISHNTVMIDWKNQERTRIGKLDTWAVLPHVAGPWQRASATTTEAYPGTTWTRTVQVLGNTASVSDVLTSARARQYDWLFHCEADDIVVPGSDPFEGDAGTTLPYVNELRWYKPKGTMTRATFLPKGKALHEGILHADIDAIGKEMLIGVGKIPAETATRQVPLLVVRQRAETAEFRVHLTPGATGGFLH